MSSNRLHEFEKQSLLYEAKHGSKQQEHNEDMTAGTALCNDVVSFIHIALVATVTQLFKDL